MNFSRTSILLLGDLITFTIAYTLMVNLRLNWINQKSLLLDQTKVFVIIFIIWLFVFYIFDLYELSRAKFNIKNIGLVVSAMIVNVLLAIIFFYFFPVEGISPKTNLILLAFFAFFLLIIWRNIFSKFYLNRFSEKIVVVGENPLTLDLINKINQNSHIGKIIGLHKIYPDFIETNCNTLINENLNSKDLVKLSKFNNLKLISTLKAYELYFGLIPVELLTEDQATEISMRYSFFKQNILYILIEKLLAIFVLVITLPLILIAVLAIVIEDGGPVFYSQKRVGKNGKTFDIYKLRSMKINSETDGIKWADRNDSRITKVGRILRKLHLDEIPQMYNIIKGDLSFIGPRPERPAFVSELEKSIPYYYLRHTIKPGFTGWAQIKYRYARTTDDSKEKFEYDLYYIKNSNVILDIGILTKTIQIIFTH